MTQGKQIAAIAGACRFVWKSSNDYRWRKISGENVRFSPFTDQNAVRAVLGVLTEDQRERYITNLVNEASIFGFGIDGTLTDEDHWRIINATEAQQIKAFLKTINKWEDQ